ncbi:MAG: hypothetical protein ACI4Q3_10735 [Kiritimatiellia bacterium]
MQAAIKEIAWVQFSDRHWINTYYVPSCTDTFAIVDVPKNAVNFGHLPEAPALRGCPPSANVSA